MMKISRKVRDEAILFSSILASTAEAGWTPYYEIADISREAFALWGEAIDHVNAVTGGFLGSMIESAEVECLLREGWTP